MPSFEKPINLSNEKRMINFIRKLSEENLQKYPTSLEDDE
jgi:hypothetical protein